MSPVGKKDPAPTAKTAGASSAPAKSPAPAPKPGVGSAAVAASWDGAFSRRKNPGCRQLI